MTDKEKIAETLKKAIKAEEDGFRFYNAISKKVKNPDARIKLETLRDDEVRHNKTLRDIFHKHVGPDIGALPEKGLSVLSDIFANDDVAEDRTEIEYINMAIEAELAATRYYQSERDLIQNDEFKAIFDALAEEEHGHYELLMAEREALSGNYNWFGYDDSAPVEH